MADMADNTDVVMAGFGGQGMLLAGKVLAQAGMDSGREVSWLPSYGPEMRGGTANVIVRIASTPIGSPLIDHPFALLAMNTPSLEKFAPSVQPDGVIVINQSLVDKDPGRDDCVVLKVPARELAEQAGDPRAANFVMLGAYAAATAAVPLAAIERAMKQEFSGGKARFAASAVAAFRAGVAIAAGGRRSDCRPGLQEGANVGRVFRPGSSTTSSISEGHQWPRS
jgi:2-oxoglutarate ferredoxin oxidoreductase subunit gamma